MILLSIDEDDVPMFGRLLDVCITTSNDCLFVFTPYIVHTFNKHFHAYEVVSVHGKHLVCRQKDFADYHVLSISKSFRHALKDKNFVCSKYHIVTVV